jgi:sulfur relay protein TusB/DsrH
MVLFIVKSAPDTPEGKRGIAMARDAAANVVIIQNAVYFALTDRLEGLPGIVYALEDDLRLRGLNNNDLKGDIRKLNYDDFIDLMVENDRVIGIF